MGGTRGDEIGLWIGVGLAFVPAALALAAVWATVDYYQHGFLVPLVSIATVRGRTAGLGPSRRRTPFLGLLGAALALYGLGALLDSATLLGLALVGAVAALVGFRWGGEGLRRLAFPVGFLVFMVPLPGSWVNPLVVELQHLASRAAELALDGLGVAMAREGNVIRLPDGGALFVAEACSGITSLVSLIPIGVLLARFTQPPGWRRWTLVAAVVPAALLCNALRVILTVLAAGVWGVERATSGALHDVAGLLTSAGAVVLVAALGAAFHRLAGRGVGSPA